MALNVRTLFRFPEESRHFEMFRKLILADETRHYYVYACRDLKCRVCGATISTGTQYMRLAFAKRNVNKALLWENYIICPTCEVRMWYYAGKPKRYYGIKTHRGKGETA